MAGSTRPGCTEPTGQNTLTNHASQNYQNPIFDKTPPKIMPLTLMETITKKPSRSDKIPRRTAPTRTCLQRGPDLDLTREDHWVCGKVIVSSDKSAVDWTSPVKKKVFRQLTTLCGGRRGAFDFLSSLKRRGLWRGGIARSPFGVGPGCFFLTQRWSRCCSWLGCWISPAGRDIFFGATFSKLWHHIPSVSFPSGCFLLPSPRGNESVFSNVMVRILLFGHRRERLHVL